MQTLICYTISGWREKHQVLKELFPYYSHRSEITYHEGILLKNQRIICLPPPFALKLSRLPIKDIFDLKIRKNVLVNLCFGR